MKISVVRPGELDSAHWSAWRALQGADGRLASAFLSPEFTCAVGGVRDSARVGILHDGGEAVGFFPFERRRFGVGKVIGAGVSDCQALVHRPGLEWDVRELLRGCDLAVWDFDHLLVSQNPFAAHHQHLYESPCIDLSDGFEAYLEGRRRASKTLVPSTLQQARKLEREVGPLRIDCDVTDRRALRMLMHWKSRQYRQTGAVDRFQLDWVVRLLNDLLDVRGPQFAASLSVLYAGDQPVAAHFGLRSSLMLSYWFPAYDANYHAYSPGRILLLRLAEMEARRGVRSIDLGRGAEEYKARFGTHAVLVADGSLKRRGVAATARLIGRFPRRIALRYVAGSSFEATARKAAGAVRRLRRSLD